MPVVLAMAVSMPTNSPLTFTKHITAVAGVHRSIGLNEGFQREDVARCIILEQIDIAGLCIYRSAVTVLVSYPDFPPPRPILPHGRHRYSRMAQWPDRKHRSSTRPGEFGLTTDQFALIHAVIVQMDADLICAFHHMVIRHDVAISAYDDTASSTLP